MQIFIYEDVGEYPALVALFQFAISFVAFVMLPMCTCIYLVKVYSKSLFLMLYDNLKVFLLMKSILDVTCYTLISIIFYEINFLLFLFCTSVFRQNGATMDPSSPTYLFICIYLFSNNPKWMPALEWFNEWIDQSINQSINHSSIKQSVGRREIKIKNVVRDSNNMFSEYGT